MSRLFKVRTLRAAGALLMLLAWLTVSNHCALAALVHARTAQHECCEPSKTPAPVDAGKVCCKVLRALPLESAAKLILSPALCVVWLNAIVIEPPADLIFAPEGAPSPPRALTFAEAVLQQSLLGHAPPARA